MDLGEVERRAIDPQSDHNRQIIRQYLETEGREVDHSLADQLILLYVTGRRTGDVRRVPLVSFPDGEDLLVIASNGGSPTHPMWYRNVVADRRVWVRKGDRVYAAEATVLEGEERRDRWLEIIGRHPVFARYQERSGRSLPLVRLSER
jgi:deazaflavin-dependent oxidoreductase (nitroreductase family)